MQENPPGPAFEAGHNILPPDTPPSAPKQRWRNRLWLHIFLFLLTVASTTMVGMRYMADFLAKQIPLATDADIFPYQWVWQHRDNLSSGFPFALTVLAILVAHEFGHFFACRFFSVQVTLPYFLPAPTLSGTAGAILRIKGRVRSRSALLVIAAAGPIAGFGVALVTMTAGILLSSEPSHPTTQIIQFQPLILHAIDALLRLIHPATPTLDRIIPHPMLTASWVGLLITSLNLVPAGQLDGGHILYALYPRYHRTVSFAVLAILVLLGIFAWVGWIVWALVLFLPGIRHPNLANESPVSPGERMLLPVCVLILAVSATLSPFANTSLIHLLRHPA